MRTARATILLFALAACDPTQPLLGPREVDVAPARRATLGETLDYPGILAAPARVEVVARTEGYLLERTFEDGSNVEQNQVLFILEADSYESRVEEARGELAGAQATLDLAETTRARDVDLPEPEAAAARARLDAARAAVRTARARLDQAETTASYTTLRAPIAGTITNRPVDVGNLVQPGDHLATIVQLDPIHLEFTVDASDLTRLRTAQDEQPILAQVVTTKGSVHPQPGRVELLGDVSDPDERKKTARATVPNPRNALIAGQKATARLLLRWHVDTVVVPVAAIQQDSDGTFVLVVDPDGRVERRMVTAGPRLGNERLIEQGVEADESVVVARTHAAVPGRTVATVPHPFAPQPTPAAAARVTPPASARATPSEPPETTATPAGPAPS